MKWVKRIVLFLVSIVALGALVFFLGPRPEFAKIDNEPVRLDQSISDIEDYIRQKERGVADLKPHNEAQVHWADSTQHKTAYSLVYLPGYSASHYEAFPLHREFAKQYGMNAFLARIADHGIADTNTFKTITPELLLASAKEAIAVGKVLGEKVIIMACSTGATYATYLAAKDPDIAALIYYSPNFALHDPAAALLNGPWSFEILSYMMGGEYRTIPYSAEAKKYWAPKYHINGLIALQDLLEQSMRPDIFKAIDQPLFIAYYYKDEENFDHIISIPAIKEMFAQVSTPDDAKQLIPIPDADSHVIASPIQSKDVESVRKATYAFAKEILEQRLSGFTKRQVLAPNPQ